MRRLLIVLILSSVSVGVSAPTRSQEYVGPAPATWLGFYGGIHLGGAWGDTTATDTGGVNTINDYWSAAPSGVVVGGQIGYNWRAGPVVYGLEGDLGYLGLGGTSSFTYVPL